MEGLRSRTRMFTGVVRRFFLVHFRGTHVRRQIDARQGDCRQCGTCCRFLFRCPMLTRAGRCMVYGKARPLACKMFPIDRKDLGDVAAKGVTCGYRFGGGKEKGK